MKKIFDDYFIQPGDITTEIGTGGSTALLPAPSTLPVSSIGQTYIISAPSGGKVTSAVKSVQGADYKGSSLNPSIFSSITDISVFNGTITGVSSSASVDLKNLDLPSTAPSYSHCSVYLVFESLNSTPTCTFNLDNGSAVTDAVDAILHPTIDGKYEAYFSVTQINRSFSFTLGIGPGDIISRIKIDLYSVDSKLGIVPLSPGTIGNFKTDGKNWYNLTSTSSGGGGSSTAVTKMVTSLSDAYSIPTADAAVGLQVYDMQTGRGYVLSAMPPSTPSNWIPQGDGDVEDSFRGTNGAFNPLVATQLCSTNQTILANSLPPTKKYKIVATADMDVVFNIPILGSSPAITGMTWHLYSGDKLTFYKTVDGSYIDGEIN